MSILLKQIGISGYEVLTIDDSGKHSRLEVGLPQRPSRCLCCGAARLHSKGPYRRQARHLKPGNRVTHTLASRRHAGVHIAEGNVSLNGQSLHGGDAAAVSEEHTLEFSATTEAPVLLFDLN